MKKYHSLLILIFLLSNCSKFPENIKTIVFPNNPWEYKLESQKNWQKGYGAICEGYDTIKTNPVYYHSFFEAHQLSQIKKYILEVNIQGNYSVYINDKQLGEVTLSPIPFDTANIKKHKARDKVKQVFTIKKTDIKEGINTLAIKINKADVFFDYPVRISLREGLKQGVDDMPKTNNKFPQVLISTYGQEIQDEPKIKGYMQVKTDTSVIESFIGIEIRGNTSQEYPKKSYGFETRDSVGDNNNISLLGMPRENDWVLYAPYGDKSLMRNVLAYGLFGKMGHYSVRTRFCEVYINDQYEGIYVLTEKIKRDKNRVNISKNTPDNITGGYIISSDRATTKYAFGSVYYHDYNNQTPYCFEYPDPAKLTTDAQKYLKTLFHDFEKATMKGNEEYLKYIDQKSFADYLLLSELSRNNDAYRLSTFYYKDRDSINPKIYMGPVWDFNLAFGMANYDNSYFFEGWVYQQNKNLIPFWWDNLTNNERFAKYLNTRWKELRTGCLSDASLIYQIDSIASYLYPFTDDNFKRWPILSRLTSPCFYNGPTYLDNVEYLKFWILRRARWMDRNI